MEEVIHVRDHAYILATSSLADDRTRVLKQGETFGVFDRYGDVQPVGLGEQGLYHEGTRYLSRLLLRLGPRRPLLLSSSVQSNNVVLAVDLTNPDLVLGEDEVEVPRGTLHLSRSRFLWEGVAYERIRIASFARRTVRVALALELDADFRDIFEVRGLSRETRGRLLPPQATPDGLVLGYEGLDGVRRRTRVAFSPTPARIAESKAEFTMELPAGGEATVELTLACERGDADAPRVLGWDEAFGHTQSRRRRGSERWARIGTSNEQFDAWLGQARADLRMMVTDTPDGPYPYAGVPWFSTVFGRDGLITALQTVWVNPPLTRGVLAHLARTQATESNAEQDAEPGKILHEARLGEMAALGEIPFGRYYGTVDATPLFVMLVGTWFRHSGDHRFVEQVWPHVEAALAWIDTYGDRDGDGFVEYGRRAGHGLVNQGWKDSDDAVFHEDGRLAEGPIAIAEVQGYVYGARKAAAEMARRLGRTTRAAELEAQADTLRRRFDEAFWLEELGTYALALDGAKHPCRVRSSNAGHLLLTGLPSPERAERIARQLLGPDFYSGWGIRTVALGEPRYNPMAYHNGSVWPHDTAFIAAGFARYGFKEEAVRVLTGMFDASLHFERHRLPELFCGFPRRPDEGPTEYPVACSPQAWASGAVFMLLSACLGLEVDAPAGQLRFRYPLLPPSLDEVRIRDLRVGRASLDLTVHRYAGDVGVNIQRREGEVEVVVVK